MALTDNTIRMANPRRKPVGLFDAGGLHIECPQRGK